MEYNYIYGGINKMFPTKYTWSKEWIQEYESPWGIIEKFKWANSINGNDVLLFLGSESTRSLKHVYTAGYSRRNLKSCDIFDENTSEEIFGFDLYSYNEKLLKKILHTFPANQITESLFFDEVRYCRKCLESGFHSIFHQLKISHLCIFHPNELLLTKCINCNNSMNTYMINKSAPEPFKCLCGYNFLKSEKINEVFNTWKSSISILNLDIKEWLNLATKNFKQEKLISTLDYSNSDELSYLIIQIANAINPEIKNKKILKINSNYKLPIRKDDKNSIEDNYKKVYQYQKYNIPFTSLGKSDSIYFYFYLHSKVIYKSVSRYILNRIIKEHKNCIQINNKTEQFGHYCPHALIYLTWRKENEDIRHNWDFNKSLYNTSTFGYKKNSNFSSIFTKGEYANQVLDLLQKLINEYYNTKNFNISSILYIFEKVLFNFLLERYIQWSEIFLDNKNHSFLYPIPKTPIFLFRLPTDEFENISFYTKSNRIAYLRHLKSEIDKNMGCKIKKNFTYPPYIPPLRVAIENMYKD